MDQINIQLNNVINVTHSISSGLPRNIRGDDAQFSGAQAIGFIVIVISFMENLKISTKEISNDFKMLLSKLNKENCDKKLSELKVNLL